MIVELLLGTRTREMRARGAKVSRVKVSRHKDGASPVPTIHVEGAGQARP